jgi:hypothetical protein
MNTNKGYYLLKNILKKDLTPPFFRVYLSASLFLMVVILYKNTPLLAGEPPVPARGAPAAAEETAPGWRSEADIREDLEIGPWAGPGLWWLLAFLVAAVGFLVWQIRRGGAGGGWNALLRRPDGENIEIVARRMLGARHGVVCVRLRDREFLLGLGGDGVSLISEWRIRQATEAGHGKPGAAELAAGQGGAGAAAD